MSVKIVMRSMKQWRDVTVSEFDCYFSLADLEKGKALSSDKFQAFGGIWYFCVKGSKEWCRGTWKLDAMLRCLSAGNVFRDMDACEMVLGDERLRPVDPDVPPGFHLYYCTYKVADRDLRENFVTEGMVCIHMTINMSNSARFVAENTDLKFMEDTTARKISVDERTTSGRLEGDTGRAVRPPSEGKTGDTGKVERPSSKSKTGGQEGDTDKAVRTPSKSRSGGLKRDTGTAERPPCKSKTGGLEGEKCKAERPQTKSKTGPRYNDPNAVIYWNTYREVGWLFVYCCCVWSVLNGCDYCWIPGAVNMVLFCHQMWDLQTKGQSRIHQNMLAGLSFCAFTAAFFHLEDRDLHTQLLCILFFLEWFIIRDLRRYPGVYEWIQEQREKFH